jgi:DNA-binding transcriptional LysR family regulator
MAMDRLAAMETFVRVVETGSFSAAARSLNVGQPAISKTIAQLEDRLGVRLLLRTTRGLTPTDAGHSFFDRARHVVEGADEAEQAARGDGADLTGRLKISAAVTFASIHVIPYLPKFLAAHPALSVDIALDDRQVDLVEQGIDVALRMGAMADSSLTARKIGECTRRVLATPAYLETAGTPLVPADLLAHQTIIYSQQGENDAWVFRQGTAEAGVTVSGRVRVSAAEGVRAAVLADMGLTLVSEWMFAPELASGAVRSVLTEWTMLPTTLWAVFPAGRMASAKARAFVAFVEDQLSEASTRSSS